MKLKCSGFFSGFCKSFQVLQQFWNNHWEKIIFGGQASAQASLVESREKSQLPDNRFFLS
jgi:hypothetical protein